MLNDGIATRWSADPYETASGAAGEGGTAAALRSLDAWAPTSPERDARRTDGDVLRELANYVGDARWCPELKSWVVPSGRDMHALVEDTRMMRAVRVFLSARHLWAMAEVQAHPDESRAKAYLKDAAKRDTRKGAADLLADFKDGGGRARAAELDACPDVIGTPGGVATLDGELLAERDDLLAGAGMQPPGRYRAAAWDVTKSTRAELESASLRREFDEDPRWARFIDEICDGDADKAAFLQRALGYSLYGGNPEKATFVLWGPSRDNGKSTLMNVVKHALGDYASTMKPDELLARRYKNPQAATPGLAKLVGRRLVDVPETPLGAELDGALLKQLASGTDELSVRNLNCDEFSYVPQFTLWLHCNSLPVVRDPSAVDPRHMFVIEFTRSFSGAARETGLAERFKTARGMHTVLAWLLAGWRDYADGGLRPPTCVTAPTSRWLTTSRSWLQAFIDEHCAIGTGKVCRTGELREAARAYCEACGETFVLRNFKAALRDSNIVEGKGTNGARLYRGIALLPGGGAVSENATGEPENCRICHSGDQSGPPRGGGITLT